MHSISNVLNNLLSIDNKLKKHIYIKLAHVDYFNFNETV